MVSNFVEMERHPSVYLPSGAPTIGNEASTLEKSDDESRNDRLCKPVKYRHYFREHQRICYYSRSCLLGSIFKGSYAVVGCYCVNDLSILVDRGDASDLFFHYLFYVICVEQVLT